MQDRLPIHPNGEGLWQLGLCPWWLGGRSEALHHSSCESGVVNQLREVLMHVSGPVQPPSLQLNSTQVIQLFCDINAVNVLVYPFAYRSRRRWRTIKRRRGGIKSGCLPGIRDDNSFGDMRFSGRGELSCPFGLSTSQIFSDKSAVLVQGGFE